MSSILPLKTLFRKKLYQSIDELQNDLDFWVEEYNKERPHSGKYCYGKTPYQTFMDSKYLAKEKMLDQLYQKHSGLTTQLTT